MEMEEQQKNWLVQWLEKPWIRTTAMVLAASMVFGLAGHGIYNMMQNRAFAKEEEIRLVQQEEQDQKKAAYEEAYIAAGKAAQAEDYGLAVEHLDRCLELVEPGSSQEADLLTTRASLNILLGKNEEALPDLEEVTKRNPQSQDLLLLKSQTELGTENYAQAASDMEKYLEQDPGNYDIRVTLTQLYEATGDYDGAADSYMELQKLRPGDYSIRLNSARCLILAGRMTEAEQVLEPYLQEETLEDRGTAYFIRALSRMQAQRFEDAILDYTAAMKEGYDPMICMEQITACTFVLGDYNGVLQCAEQVLKLQPEGSKDPGFYQQVGVSALTLGQSQLALTSLSQSIQLDPTYPGSYYYRGLYLFQSGNWKAAVEDFTKSIEQEYLTQNCYYNRGLCYAQLLDYNKAFEDMERTVNHGEDQELITLAQDLMPVLKEVIDTEKK